MNHLNDASVDRRVADWLEDDPDTAPDAVLDTVLAAFPSIPQRRRLFGLAGRRTGGARAALKFALGAAASVAMALAALEVILPGSIGVGWPTATPLSPALAFDREVDGNTDVYTVNGDGTGLSRITNDPEDDTDPTWSPDGASLAFLREGDIYVVGVESRVERRLTSSPDEDREPAFSPDGTTIAFSRGTEIWVVGIDGDLPRRVLEAPPYVCCPAWTPDGRTLLLNRDSTAGGGIEIVELDLETGGLTPLTDRAEGEDTRFALSPDGRRIAYQSENDPGGLFVMNRDGSRSTHVFGGSNPGSPTAWTPDGRLISFESGGWIYLIAPDGSGFRQLIQGRNPDWTKGGM
jgi:Tol biopolymer transport system component